VTDHRDGAHEDEYDADREGKWAADAMLKMIKLDIATLQATFDRTGGAG
jgi:hypothetical protein